MKFMKWLTIASIIAMPIVFICQLFVGAGPEAGVILSPLVFASGAWLMYGLYKLSDESDRVEKTITETNMTPAEAALYRQQHAIKQSNDAIMFGQWSKR